MTVNSQLRPDKKHLVHGIFLLKKLEQVHYTSEGNQASDGNFQGKSSLEKKAK